ncbi:Uma2 family endonuclease [Laspinema olomoucense]|uniref:Uma2 family endonuclease n=1 Tax=Laspinema olomoucense TaxID=3231600 RepID=UPI0021BB85BC|nr:Uma2 family endonuclease [Laspinema sp. D3c]MCT7995674.1 Uma2 family endonuclease [Laspinema sp. D3c]
MVTETTTAPKTSIIYPESDGQPMADNTEQFRWIVTIQGGIDALFKDDLNVFVAGDLLWYPVEGNNKLRVAPDVMVAFGRPKGKRGSYLQWQEDNIPPQVVFEVLSPGNTLTEMAKKLEFYQRYGVEEYYIYDPDRIDFGGWIRTDNQLTSIESITGWVSPRLGVRFEMAEEGLELYRPDGRKFSTYIELDTQRQLAEERAQQESERANRLAEKLRELGIDPDAM